MFLVLSSRPAIFFRGQRPGVRKKKPQVADFGRDFDDRHARGADHWLGPAERL